MLKFVVQLLLGSENGLVKDRRKMYVFDNFVIYQGYHVLDLRWGLLCLSGYPRVLSLIHI